MKLAHLLPVPIIDATPSSQTVHLALAPLVLQYKSYETYLRTRLLRRNTVIIDNPVHENEPVDPVGWLSVIRKLHPTIAVLPDTIDDDSLTVQQALQHAPQALKYGVKLMAVPHGVTQADFNSCVLALAKVPGVTHIGISLERRLDDDEAVKRRFERLNWIRHTEALDSLQVHLLGVSERAVEFVPHPVWSRAATTDASKFAVFALCGTPQLPPAPVTASYPGRLPFGGSMEYFHARPQFRPYGKYNLTRNLELWNRYAETGVTR